MDLRELNHHKILSPSPHAVVDFYLYNKLIYVFVLLLCVRVVVLVWSVGQTLCPQADVTEA